MYRHLVKSMTTIAILLAATGVAIAGSTPTKLSSYATDLPLGESVHTIRVELVSKSALKAKCPNQARGCYWRGPDVMYVPASKRRQGSYEKSLRISVHKWGKAPCKRTLACWDGEVLHTSFRRSVDHPRQGELGWALAEALGFQSRNLETIGHEMMHVLGKTHFDNHLIANN